MFDTEKDYYNSIKHAQVYTSTETKPRSNKLLIFNFIALGLLGYITFSYLGHNQNTFSSSIIKEAVLGVSETVDDTELENDKLMKILKGEQVVSTPNTMKILSTKASIQSKSSYTEAISKVLDDNDRSGFKGRIAVVNQDEN